MIVTIKFDYSAFNGVSRADYNTIRVENPQWELDEWKEGAASVPGYWGRDILIDLLTDGPMLTNLGVKFQIVRFRSAYIPGRPMRDGEAHWNRETQGPTNPTIHLHIPNIGLIAMDEVQVLEDACTDDLQRELDAGWRIVAVCPPNAARRPDYVMGRTRPAT